MRSLLTVVVLAFFIFILNPAPASCQTHVDLRVTLGDLYLRTDGAPLSGPFREVATRIDDTKIDNDAVGDTTRFFETKGALAQLVSGLSTCARQFDFENSFDDDRGSYAPSKGDSYNANYRWLDSGSGWDQYKNHDPKICWPHPNVPPSSNGDPAPDPTPEPASIFLFGSGLLMVGGLLRKRLRTA
jgi:hypothetical protein